MAWIPFEARDASLQQQVSTAAAAAQPLLAPDDFYNQHDLGLMDPGQLSRWLDNALAKQASTPSRSENREESQSEISESEAFDVRTLRWVRLNGRTAADKAYAKQRYRRLLFELWRKHIADTGQTYYPELRDDLMDHYKWLSDQDNV